MTPEQSLALMLITAVSGLGLAIVLAYLITRKDP